jgi:hypothetical protein
MNIREHIIKAFRDVLPPSPDNITACPCLECLEIAQYFRGTSWQGHPPRDLRIHSAALSLFTPAAYRYWLPAFMLAEIDDPETADIIAEGIAYDFTESNLRDARVSHFTQGELRAIAAFFDECVRRYAAFGMFSQAAETVRSISHSAETDEN